MGPNAGSTGGAGNRYVIFSSDCARTAGAANRPAPSAAPAVTIWRRENRVLCIVLSLDKSSLRRSAIGTVAASHYTRHSWSGICRKQANKQAKKRANRQARRGPMRERRREIF